MTRHDLCCLALLFSVGCGVDPLPEEYGIYANSECGQVRLPGQEIELKGTLLSFVSGVEGPTGAECGRVTNFVMFAKDLDATGVGLTRLDYVDVAAVGDRVASQLSGQSTISVGLWMPAQEIEFTVRPASRPDTYIVTPSRSLAGGFYALYFNGFGVAVPGQRKRVYDVVVGSAEHFPSRKQRLAAKQEETKRAAEVLVQKMNQMFNSGNFENLDEVYRPGGRRVDGRERQEFLTGVKTWRDTSGDILRSEISSWSMSDDGVSAAGVVSTTYRKKDLQKEALTISLVEGKYYITALY